MKQLDSGKFESKFKCIPREPLVAGLTDLSQEQLLKKDREMHIKSLTKSDMLLCHIKTQHGDRDDMTIDTEKFNTKAG